jgi:hypothetical protein
MYPNIVSMKYLYTYYEHPITTRLFEDYFQLFYRTKAIIFLNVSMKYLLIVKALVPFYLIFSPKVL